MVVSDMRAGAEQKASAMVIAAMVAEREASQGMEQMAAAATDAASVVVAPAASMPAPEARLMKRREGMLAFELSEVTAAGTELRH